MNRNTSKWVIGISSVALFTGLLYAEGQISGKYETETETVIETSDSSFGSNYNVQSYKSKDLFTGFLTDVQDLSRLKNMNSEEQGERESWISDLDWDQKELTIAPREDRSTEQPSPLRTRRS
ncbi:hypothetical protein M6D81_29865 [Paenibacillus sp. J5C_2022]|uniref:hypothetical protein n=1 Tax=Paenibacillus sp. J5C2022 TaxID=2977129 RepID=UPI0021CEB612|nr:hypothetical protein [Paenibacillus sp. J5C2022]MCU6712917.1 hypothetical protein [Paenibacillus sp. J5C2022]